ncbi:MAG: class I SAM-dependent methyltransferase [Gemmatimonadetes bacterium]|nr:class I SAM-dependent methyltransferase [Gemmatimonadota bacterium]
MRVLPHFLLWRLGLARAETQTTEAERDCLARHAAGRQRLVEIGVWHGVTTSRLRAAMASEGQIFAVDPYPAGRLGFSAQRYIARREVRKSKNGHVRWLRSTGAEAGRAFVMLKEAPVDFVFIDGDHTYVGLREDWEAWNGLVEPGGVIALHDSRSTPERDIEKAGSVRFTREVILKDPRFTEVDAVDSLTVLRRVG